MLHSIKLLGHPNVQIFTKDSVMAIFHFMMEVTSSIHTKRVNISTKHVIVFWIRLSSWWFFACLLMMFNQFFHLSPQCSPLALLMKAFCFFHDVFITSCVALHCLWNVNWKLLSTRYYLVVNLLLHYYQFVVALHVLSTRLELPYCRLPFWAQIIFITLVVGLLLCCVNCVWGASSWRCQHALLNSTYCCIVCVVCEVKVVSLPCPYELQLYLSFLLSIVLVLCEVWICCKVSCVVCEVKTPSLPCITKFRLFSSPLLLTSCVVWTMCEVQAKGIKLLVLCEVNFLSLPCLLDLNYLHHFCFWLVFELCEASTCYKVSCVVCEVEIPSLPCLSKSKSSSSTLLLSCSYTMWTMCEVQVEHQLIVVIHALCVKWELYHHTFWIGIASLFLPPWLFPRFWHDWVTKTQQKKIDPKFILQAL